MRILIIAIVFVANILVSPLLISSVVTQQSKTNTRTLKIEVHYDKKKDMTTVSIDELILRDTAGPYERTGMYIFFKYSKRAIVKPMELGIIFNYSRKIQSRSKRRV